MYVHNPLRAKYFHGVLAANVHACLLKPSIGKARSLNVSSVKYLVAKYVKKAGIRKKVSVHTLRHTFGAHKADKQMGIATLQELIGHKKKETTLKYIHLANRPF
jgi:integrase/recombinase XerD